ncbi:uncharacterized protein METZ01_LOCUS494675, partial [marine metagenome]
WNHLYVHHDGYPEGAAIYLEDAHTVEKFIRKNDRAEVTASHEVHSDTEFRYDIHRHGDAFATSIGLKAYKREGYGEDATWSEFFDGSLNNFIETYKNTPHAEDIEVGKNYTPTRLPWKVA